jgi:oligopeptide transport system substrate-binding protein
VRQAFAFATDREALMQSLWRGFYLPANGGIIPPSLPGHTDGIALPFNPERARQLLAEAGYPDGCGFPFIGTLSGNYKSVVLMDEVLKQQWKTHLGVDITWQYVDMTSKFWKVDSLPNLYRVSVGTDFDPDIQFRTFVKFVFRADSWGNSRFDELVEQARYIRDHPERMQLYRQAEEILLDDAVVIPLYYQYDPYLVQPWVKNFSVSSAGNWFWKNVVIEPH